MQFVQQEAAKVVDRVIRNGRNLTDALAEAIKLSKLTGQSRGALQDLCYGTLRYQNRLAFMLDRLLNKPLQNPLVGSLLQVALYQLQYTRARSHTIVDQAVRATKDIHPATAGLVNAVLRNFLRQREELQRVADLQSTTRYAYPEWWVNKLSGQYGEHAPDILQAGNTHPPMTLRINQQHGDSDTYQARLAAAGIDARPLSTGALQLIRPVPVDRLPGFFTGDVSVQDAGAQYAAKLLAVADGMRVLDACAAPGGKTAHLLECADIELLSLDKDEGRLQRIHENLQRLGLHADVRQGDAALPDTWWDGRPFQRILADVPCSASGVVRRHPDIKWLRRPEDIENFARQQTQILQALWPLLAVDGRLLYVTCSIFAQENQQVIEPFLTKHADARREPTGIVQIDGAAGQLLPCDEHDGFFYAVLRKTA
ncbi:MAG: 16S rRNA (cytosine(967)-C(5))-methyltransferase RsmB [Pseudomonadota bacterium]